jgi:hypothetical protein
MNSTQPKARVFVSCGQKDNKEKALAREIYETLAGPEFGFEPYVADLEHTQKEVVQSVFDALSESEYFLLIDFRRERLGCTPSTEKVYRGSLFTQQELAIASFLGIEQLRFKEKGVEWKGISQLLQGKPIEFGSRSKLVDTIRKEIQCRKWSSGWKNTLQIVEENGIERVPRNRPNDPNYRGTADFYHIVVKNLHNRKMALVCRVLAEFESGTPAPPVLCDHLEQKWAGMLYNQAVAIRPNPGSRRACACFVERGQNGKSLGVFFHQFGIDTDSAKAATQCPPGEYVLKYSAVSANFPTAIRRFKLTIDDANEIRLEAVAEG